MIARRFVRALGLGASLAVLAASAVYADNFQVNDISATTVTTGNTATADYRIVATGGGGSEPAGCNVDSSNPAGVTFSITGGSSGGVTYSPAAGLTFTECQGGGDANEQTVTFTGVSAGTYTITPVITGGRSGSTWGLGGGTFTLTVNTPPPSDTTAPVITPNVAGTPGANGWYTSDVSVSWTVVDAESSVTSTSGCDTTSLTSETTGVTLTCTATSAGGTASDSITIKIDKTGPSAALTPTGTSGDNGWYTSNVDVAASGSDAISGPVTCTVDGGATPKTFSAETSGTTVDGECTNDAGLSTAASPITIKIDKTGPSAALTPTGTSGDNGWYTSNVDVAASGSDAISGPVTCTVDGGATPKTFSAETSGTTVDGECTNDAGLSTAASPITIKIDKTGPSAALTPTGTSGDNGWYTSNVDVAASGSDAISGPVTCTVDGGATPKTFSAETSGTTVDGECTNDAGLSTAASPITIKIDKTGPSAALTPTGTSGDNGWYTSNVDVAASGSDAISGPVTCTVDGGATPKTFSAETSGTTVDGECTNDAGLSTAASPITIKIDKTAPTSLAFVGGGLTDGASYVFGSVPAGPTGCTADGAISGLASCNVSGYGTSVGMHTVTATATDNAGNVATKELSYTVLAWTLNGFYQPVDMGITNSVKGGSTVPLKFEIFAGSNELTSTSAIKSFTVTKTGCAAGAPTDDIEVYSTGGTILRYDSTGGQFIQNWQTPKGAGICYRVVMATQDLSTLVATFITK